MFTDPEFFRWKRLMWASRQRAGPLTAFFVVVIAAVIAGCVVAGVPWLLAVVVAIYIGVFAAVGLWASWFYLIIPVLISLTCAVPAAGIGAVVGGPWGIAALCVIALPGFAGFCLGRLARATLLSDFPGSE